LRYNRYRNKTFFFEIEPTGSSINFGPTYKNYTFKLNQDWNFDFNVTNYFNISNIPDFVINEADNHQFVYNLHDYIVTSEPENIIFAFDYEFSSMGAYFNFDEETWLLTVNFFPELNLDYHTNNEIQIESNIALGNEINEQVFFINYIPSHKAVIGHVQDHYTNEPIFNSSVNSTTPVGEMMFINDNQTFLGFYAYGSEGDHLYIQKEGYIYSARLVRANDNLDQDLNFTLIPETYNQSTLHDELFDTLFRWSNSGTVRQSDYTEDLMTYSICTTGFEGYNVGNDELTNINFSLSQVAEFTYNYHQPFNGYFEYRNNQTNCIIEEPELGYISIIWNGSMNPDESIVEYLYWGNKIYGATIKLGGNNQSILTQKVIQAISTPNLQSNLTNSVFFGNGIAELSYEDFKWGERLYMRRTKNLAPDTDYALAEIEFQDIKLTTAKYSNGKQEISTKIIGKAKSKEELKIKFNPYKENFSFSKITKDKIRLLFI
jgi:hypothetical protein